MLFAALPVFLFPIGVKHKEWPEHEADERSAAVSDGTDRCSSGALFVAEPQRGNFCETVLEEGVTKRSNALPAHEDIKIVRQCD